MRHTHPARAELVVLALAVPGEADLDPAPFVAIDLLAGWADNGSHVRAVDARFGQGGRAPFAPTGHQYCFLPVTGTLLGTGGFFLQAGELGALVVHADRAPMHVEVFTRVFDKREAQPRLQAYIVTLHLGKAGIMTQGRKAGGGERDADRIPFVAPGVVEALIIQRLMGDAAVIRAVFLAVLRIGEGVVPLHLPGATHLFAVAQAAQARPGLIAAAVGAVQYLIGADVVVIVKPFIVVIGLDCAMADLPQRQQPVGDDQQVVFRRVLEAVDEAFFASQTGNKVEVGFTGLHAELAHLVLADALDLETADALALQHQVENLRHGLVLEDAPVRTQPGPGQHRLDQGAVTGAIKTRLTLAEGADQAVHIAQRAFAAPDREQHRFVEQLAEVDIVFETDQLQLQLERRADGFVEFERNHFELTLASQWLEGETQIGLAWHVDSPCYCCKMRSSDSRTSAVSRSSR
ncbi:hypothetical protein D3C76_797440 [compost metagenome]